jgi:hypothetical protein
VLCGKLLDHLATLQLILQPLQQKPAADFKGHQSRWQREELSGIKPAWAEWGSAFLNVDRKHGRVHGPITCLIKARGKSAEKKESAALIRGTAWNKQLRKPSRSGSTGPAVN